MLTSFVSENENFFYDGRRTKYTCNYINYLPMQYVNSIISQCVNWLE